jgi:hypothetical protein
LQRKFISVQQRQAPVHSQALLQALVRAPPQVWVQTQAQVVSAAQAVMQLHLQLQLQMQTQAQVQVQARAQTHGHRPSVLGCSAR